jgi:Lipopolysaccharide-assembly
LKRGDHATIVHRESPALCVLIFVLPLLAVSCGYHTAGKADLVPKTIHTIAIPAFGNTTTRYKLTGWLSEAIARELISRTRYRVVTDESAADAVLSGTVNNFASFPTVFDPATGRASAVEVHVYLKVTLVERATGKTIFTRPNFEVRERYQISVDPSAFFEESDTALDRLSRQTARQIVSAILENF